MTYSELHRRFAEVFDSVVEDHEEVVITRAGRESAVIVSLEDYESVKEGGIGATEPADVGRLVASIRELESGHGTSRWAP